MTHKRYQVRPGVFSSYNPAVIKYLNVLSLAKHKTPFARLDSVEREGIINKVKILKAEKMAKAKGLLE